MKAYATHILIGFCVLVLGVSAPVTVYIMRPPAVTPGPDVEPVVVSKFPQLVREAWKANGGTPEDACLLVDSYTAIAGILIADTDKNLKTTEDFDKFVRLGNKLTYGSEKPFADKYKFLRDLVQAECLQRGIWEDATGDGIPDSGPLDHDGMAKLLSETAEGLQ